MSFYSSIQAAGTYIIIILFQNQSLGQTVHAIPI